MDTQTIYQLVDIDDPNKFVERTLNNFAKDNPPDKRWLGLILLSSDYRDEHEAFDDLEQIFKRIITSQLQKACVDAKLPRNDKVLINHDGYRDRYFSYDHLDMTIKTEIGGNRQPEYQAVKIWSTLYHKYFVRHDLNSERFAEAIKLTSRQIRNYKRDGIQLLTLQLIAIEKQRLKEKQEQYQFQPQTYSEIEAENLIGLAKSARSLHGEQVALQKCEDALQYALKNNLARYYVKAAAIMVFTLFQGGSEYIANAANVLTQVEQSPLITTLEENPEKAWVMTKIHSMWAHIWRRRGNLSKAIDTVNHAIEWLDRLHGVDIELSKETYFIRGVMYWSSGLYTLAEADLIFVLDLKPQHKYDIYEMLGLVNWSMSRYTVAEEHFYLAIEEAKAWQDNWHLACGQGNLGLIYLTQFRLKESQYYIELHRSKAEQLKSWKEFNRATANLGVVYLYQQKYDSAISLLEQSRQSYDQMSSFESLVVIYTNLSQAYTMTGDHIKALSYAQSAQEIAETIVGSYPTRLIVHRCLGECELLEIEQRIHHLQIALDLSQDDRVFDKAACQLGLSYLYAKIGKQTHYKETGADILRSIGAQRWLGKIKSGYPHLPLFI